MFTLSHMPIIKELFDKFNQITIFFAIAQDMVVQNLFSQFVVVFRHDAGIPFFLHAVHIPLAKVLFHTRVPANKQNSIEKDALPHSKASSLCNACSFYQSVQAGFSRGIPYSCRSIWLSWGISRPVL